MNKKIITIFAIVAIIVVVAGIPLALISGYGGGSDASEPIADSGLPEEITVDYANWSYLSLVLRDQKFLEEEFGKDNVKVNWVLSQGGPYAMQFLGSGSVDIATAAGVCGLMSYSNGINVKGVYALNTHPNEIMVGANSDINELEDLRGKSIAAPIGTDPYIFLLRALATVGLTKNDVNIIPLQSQEGLQSFFQGDIDAMATGGPGGPVAKIKANAKTMYSSVELSTPNFLFVRQEFYEKYPEAVLRVMAAYEKSRAWAKEHPEEYIALIIRESKMNDELTRLVLKDDYIDSGEITDAQLRSVAGTEAALKQIGILRKDHDVQKTVDELFDKSLFHKL